MLSILVGGPSSGAQESSGDLSLSEKAGTCLVEMSSLQAGVMLPAMRSTLMSQQHTLQKVSLNRSSADKLCADLVTNCDQRLAGA